MSRARLISEQEKKFAELYTTNGRDAPRAYIDAGFKVTKTNYGYHLRNKKQVAEYIDHLTAGNLKTELEEAGDCDEKRWMIMVMDTVRRAKAANNFAGEQRGQDMIARKLGLYSDELPTGTTINQLITSDPEVRKKQIESELQLLQIIQAEDYCVATE